MHITYKQGVVSYIPLVSSNHINDDNNNDNNNSNNNDNDKLNNYT